MAVERLQKVLARAGFGSRRRCEELILEGKVEVDGQVVTQLGTKVDPETQKIKCLGRWVREPRKIYLMLHKPKRYIVSMADELGRKTVMDLVPRGQRIYPVGRLDKDSEGLLLLTNDGEFANLLTHPRYRVDKTYHVVLDGRITPEQKARIERGVWLSEGKTGRAKIAVKKLLKDQTVLDISIREGLNREVRRIFARVGLKVRRLKRIRIGTLDLGSLPKGAFRELTRAEVEALKSVALRGGEHGKDA